MRPHTVGALLLAALLIPATAAAKDVPFEVVGQGAHSGQTAPGNYVIKSKKQLQDKNLERLVPNLQIDWDEEMLVAVLMGPRSTGGYSIAVEQIQLETLRYTPPFTSWHIPTGIRTLTVTVRNTSPGPNDIVTMAFTSPYQLVKLRKVRAFSRFKTIDTKHTVFSNLRRSVSDRIGTGTFTLDGSGRATFVRAVHPPNVGMAAPIQGQATPDELKALENAILRAEFADLPERLPEPTFIVAPTRFTLTIDGHTVRGAYNVYLSYEARVAPVMKAIDVIIGRLVKANPEPQIVVGKVDVRGWYGFRSVWIVSEDKETRVEPWKFASKLIPFEGHEVRVSGELKGSRIQAKDLISPQRKNLTASVSLSDDGKVELRQLFATPLGGRMVPFPLKMTAFGPGAKVLTKLQPGRVVKVDAWVFTNPLRIGREAYVVGVFGVVSTKSLLTRYGVPVNRVKPGDEVKVLRLSTNGKSIKVQPESGRPGYLALSKVDIGQATPPVLPPVVIGRTSGLSGNLPSTD